MKRRPHTVFLWLNVPCHAPAPGKGVQGTRGVHWAAPRGGGTGRGGTRSCSPDFVRPTLTVPYSSSRTRPAVQAPCDTPCAAAPFAAHRLLAVYAVSSGRLAAGQELHRLGPEPTAATSFATHEPRWSASRPRMSLFPLLRADTPGPIMHLRAQLLASRTARAPTGSVRGMLSLLCCSWRARTAPRRAMRPARCVGSQDLYTGVRLRVCLCLLV